MTGSQEGMAASLETGAVGGTLCWMHQSETGSLEGMAVCHECRQAGCIRRGMSVRMRRTAA